MNNRFARIVCGFMSVIMFVFSAVNIVPTMKAAAEVVDNVINVTEYSATINGQEINDYMTVKNGDVFVLDLKWTVTSDAYAAPVTFKYNLNLKNVDLDGWEYAATHARYYVSGGYLYIELEQGSAGRSGSCRIEGELNIDKTTVNSDNKTVISYINKVYNPYTYQFKSDLWVSKSAGDFRKVGDKYYQDFTVNVQNGSGNDATDVKLTDVFLTDAGSLYTGGIVDFTAKRNDVADLSLTLGADNTVDIGTIPAGDKVTFTYSIEVDPAKALAGMDGKNEAVVNYTDVSGSKTITHAAYARPALPDIHKSGSVDTAADTITWTITVSPNMMSGAAITLTDIPDSTYLKASDVAAAINSTKADSAAVVGGNVTVDLTKFTPDGDGKFIINYSTPIPDNAKGTIFGTNISNKIAANFTSGTTTIPDEYTGNVTIPGSQTSFISKSGQVPDADGKLTWTINIDVPNDPSVTNINIYDNTAGSANKHKIDYTSFTYTADGAPVNMSVAKKTDYDFDVLLGNTAYCQNDSRYYDYEALRLKGKTLVITYKTIPEDDDYSARTYSNKVDMWLKGASEIQRTSEAVVTPDFEMKKSGSYKSGMTDRGYIEWAVEITKKGTHTFAADDTITIIDEIPAKHSYKSLVSTYLEGIYPNPAPVVTPNGQNVTFEFTLSAAEAAALNNGKKLTMKFATIMSEADFSEAVFSSETDIVVKNTARVIIDGDETKISGTASIPANSKRVLEKACTNQVKGTSDEFTASYSINVNTDKLDIIPGTGGSKDTIVLKDKLGYFLSPLESTISISPADGASWTYSETDNVITFTLKDNTSYIINYDVKGKKVSLGNTISAADISALYDNTVTLTGGNDETKSSKAAILSTTYTSSADYTYEIFINGKKLWSTSETGYGDEILPHNIQVIIRRDTYNILDKLIESDRIIYDETVSSDASGNWTFKVEGLKNMETNGNRYEYKLEEVSVDGFTMGDVTKSGDVEHLNFEWKNTFTAPLEEYGKVQVNKSWDDRNNAGGTRPDEITLYLKTAEGKTVDTKVIDIAGGDTTAVFEKVSLYDYSRDTSGKLIRTPRKYVIEEKAVSGYKSVTSAVFTLTDASTAGLVINTPKIIEITNTLGGAPGQTDGEEDKPQDTPDVPQGPTGSQPSYTTPKPPVTAPSGGNESDNNDEKPSVTVAPDGGDDEPSVTAAPDGDDDEPSVTTAPDDDDEPSVTTAPDDDEPSSTKKTTASENEVTETDVDGEVVTSKTTAAPDDTEIEREESTTTTKPAVGDPELTTDRFSDETSSGSTDIEENPVTGVSSKLALLGVLALGTWALFPRRKK